MTIYRLRVAGVPAPKGSLKCVGRGARHQLIEDDKTGARRRWRKTLTEAAQQLAGRLPAPLDGPIAVGVLFVLPRPRASRRQLPTARSAGDLDKLLRMVADVLTCADVIVDDSRIILTIPAKVYETEGRPPGVVIYVTDDPNPHARILSAVLDAAPELKEMGK